MLCASPGHVSNTTGKLAKQVLTLCEEEPQLQFRPWLTLAGNWPVSWVHQVWLNNSTLTLWIFTNAVTVAFHTIPLHTDCCLLYTDNVLHISTVIQHTIGVYMGISHIYCHTTYSGGVYGYITHLLSSNTESDDNAFHTFSIKKVITEISEVILFLPSRTTWRNIITYPFLVKLAVMRPMYLSCLRPSAYDAISGHAYKIFVSSQVNTSYTSFNISKTLLGETLKLSSHTYHTSVQIRNLCNSFFDHL